MLASMRTVNWGESQVTKEGFATLTLVLSLIAAALALSAALIEYLLQGEVKVALLAAGLLLLAFGIGAKRRTAR